MFLLLLYFLRKKTQSPNITVNTVHKPTGLCTGLSRNPHTIVLALSFSIFFFFFIFFINTVFTHIFFHLPLVKPGVLARSCNPSYREARTVGCSASSTMAVGLIRPQVCCGQPPEEDTVLRWWSMPYCMQHRVTRVRAQTPDPVLNIVILYEKPNKKIYKKNFHFVLFYRFPCLKKSIPPHPHHSYFFFFSNLSLSLANLPICSFFAISHYFQKIISLHPTQLLRTFFLHRSF